MTFIQTLPHIIWNELTIPITPLSTQAKQDAQLYARIFLVLGFSCILIIIMALAVGSWQGALLTVPSLCANYIFYRISRTRFYYVIPPIAVSLVLILNWVDIAFVSKGAGVWMLGLSIYLASFFYKVRSLIVWSSIAICGAMLVFLLRGLPVTNASLVLTIGFMCVVIINKMTVQRRNLLLKESEARLRAAIDGSLDIFLLAKQVNGTDEFEITDGNAVATNIANKKLPQSSSKLSGKLVAAHLPHHDMLTDCQQAILHQQNIHKEQELENGRWIEYQIVPFEQNIALTIRDITRKKEASAQAFQLAIQQERVAILTHFITDASHEFRTPLTVIETSNYLLTKAEQPEQKQKYSMRISQQVKRIVQLVDKLAFFSKLETVQLLQTQPTAIHEPLTNLKTELSEQLEQSNLTFDIEYTAEPPLLLPIHEDYFMAALRELLANCIRYSSVDGTIQLKVTQNTHIARIVIEDTAPPIPAAVLPKVFDLFYREDEAHTTPGFGLGLPIARRIIELHEGVITIRPNPTIGNTVIIMLPLAAENTVLSPQSAVKN